MAVKFSNTASAQLSGSIDTDDTSLALQSGAGARFPTLSPGDWFPLVVLDSEGLEIMRVTGRSGDVLTVVRGQEGTAGRNFSAGARVDLRITAAAIAAIQSELNTAISDAVNGAVETLGGALSAPSGTRMLFQQTAAPTGWTKVTTHNDKALRIVSGTVGSGGSVNFSTLFGRTATDGHSLSVGQLAAHYHSVYLDDPGHGHNLSGNAMRSGGSNPLGGSGGTFTSSDYAVVANTTGITIRDQAGGGGNANRTAAAGSGEAHSHNIDMRVQYVDVIIAQKAA